MSDGAGPIAGLVFDLDGVLIDSIEVMRKAFERAYEVTVGPGPAPFAEYLHHLGRHMPETLAIMGLPADMYQPFVRFSRELVHLVPVHSFAPELLAGLRERGLRLAVATGKTHDRACQVLRATGLLDLLDEVVGSDEVAHSKPAPDIVRLALARLGLSPSDALMIGDSPLDLQAGRAAGTRTVAALWGQGSREMLLAEHPDYQATSCEHLAVVLAGVPAI